MNGTLTKSIRAAGPPRTRLAVLVATDGSEHALKAVRFIAKMLAQGQAEVQLLTVLSMELQPYSYMGELSDAEARRARIEEVAGQAFRTARSVFEEAGQTTTTRSRLGNPPDEILAQIDEWHPDLVVVGRRGLSRRASAVLGSVSTYLLRHSSVPVLVVP